MDDSTTAYEIRRLRDQLTAVQRSQMRANSRIQKAVVSVGFALAMVMFAIWANITHYDLAWWQTLLVVIGAPLAIGYINSSIERDEEPRG